MGRGLVIVGVLGALCLALYLFAAEDTSRAEAERDASRSTAVRYGGGAGSPAGTVLPHDAGLSPKPVSEPTELRPRADLPRAALLDKAPAHTRTISGIVRRQSDDSPLPGLRVRVSPEGFDPIEVHTLEDPPGRFTLEGVPHGTDSLTLLSDGPWPERQASHPIQAGPKDLHDLVLHFDSGFAVRGLVTDEQGAPVPRAVADAQQRGEVPADNAGRFLLPDIAPRAEAESVQIGARAPWYQRATEDVVIPRSSSEVPSVQITLMGSGALEGQVTDAKGRPLEDASVQLSYVMTTTHGGSAASGLEATSDEKGSYRVDHVPPGRYIVQISPPGPRGVWQGGVLDVTPQPAPSTAVEVWLPDIAVRVGEATRLDVSLPQGASVSGRVSDAYGAPIPGATLLLERSVRWPAPDLSGSSSTTSGELRIVSRRSGDKPGETLLTIKEFETTADERGAYTFPGLSPGAKQLTVRDPSGERVAQRLELELLGGQSLTRNIQLQAGITLRSRVVDQAGAPLEGASVQARPSDTTLLDSSDGVATDHDGRFEIRGLAPGEMRLSIFMSGYQGLFETVQSTSPEPEYVLLPAPSVQGRVLAALHEEPLTQFTVIVSCAGSTWSNQGSFEEGRFKSDVNDDELATVTIRAPGYTSQTMEDVRPSETALRPLEFLMHRDP